MLVEVEAEADADGTLLRWRSDITSATAIPAGPGRGNDPTLLVGQSMIAERLPGAALDQPAAGRRRRGAAQRDAALSRAGAACRR